MTCVAVIGSEGMLGKFLSPYLAQKGYKVVQIDKQLDGLNGKDMSNPEEAYNLISSFMPDIIINLAAYTDVDGCERNPNLSYLLNTKIVENITKWIEDCKPNCWLIQISTDQVYNGNGPFTEDGVNLTNYYSFSKYAGEVAASRVNSTILRTNFIGKSKEDSGRVSFSDWIVNSAQSCKVFNVYDDIMFSPITMIYLSEVIEIAALKKIKGVFNLGSKMGISKADFAFLFAEKIGLDMSNAVRGNSNLSNFKAFRPKDMRLNSEKFEKIFDIQLPDTLQVIDILAEEYT